MTAETIDPDVFAIWVPKFLKAHDIPPSTWFKLKKEGRAPTTLKIGRRDYVRPGDAEDWLEKLSRGEI